MKSRVFFDADQPRHALRAACAWNDAEGDFGKPESSTRHRDAVMTGQGDFETAAHDRAVHPGDDRNGQLLDLPKQVAVLRLLGRPGKFADVGAGEKCAAFADEHDGRDPGTRTNARHRAEQPFSYGRRDGVDRRIADGDDGDIAVHGQRHDIRTHGDLLEKDDSVVTTV